MDRILVLTDEAGEARLRLTGQGLPIGAGIGLEIFGETAFGTVLNGPSPPEPTVSS